MQICKLRLVRFRNHADTYVDFAPGLNLICGPNGSGKTSLLEAIYLVATGRSFRTFDDQCLLADHAQSAAVQAEIAKGGRNLSVAMSFGRKRQYELNGAVYRRARDITGLLRCVVFSPDDLGLIKGAPSGRRAFVDAAMQDLAPRTELICSDWERTLKQRNQLLKSLSGRPVQPGAFDTWTALLVEKGAQLAAERIRVVGLLAPQFTAAALELGGLCAQLAYTPSWGPLEMADQAVEPEHLASHLAQSLASIGALEIKRGITLAGPHLDDLTITLGGRDARTRASQGEQRILALALKLAHLRVLESTLGDEPVLLLDDVFSELDMPRRIALLECLPAAQILLSAATPAGDKQPPKELFDLLSQAGILNASFEKHVTPPSWKLISIQAGQVFAPNEISCVAEADSAKSPSV